MQWADGKIRCHWVSPTNTTYLRYHDEEWGRPVHDDHMLFEMLILENFQAGLTWECVLNKREAFRRAFDGFDLRKVASYSEEKLTALQADSGIIRNRLKIRAAVVNAQVFQKIHPRRLCLHLRDAVRHFAGHLLQSHARQAPFQNGAAAPPLRALRLERGKACRRLHQRERAVLSGGAVRSTQQISFLRNGKPFLKNERGCAALCASPPLAARHSLCEKYFSPRTGRGEK